jgi:hypothetical protein
VAVRTIAVAGSTRQPVAYIDWEHVDNEDPKARNQVRVTPYFLRSGAGAPGEVQSAAATAVSLPIVGTVTNVASVSLTVGTWLVSCVAVMTSSGSAITAGQIGITTTSATLTGNNGDRYVELGNNLLPIRFNAAVPDLPLTLAAAQSVYLVASGTAAAGTIACNGRISAVRTIDEPTVNAPVANVVLFFSGG